MDIYTIYHIPGKKIGCTDNLERRVVKKQGYANYQILEQHEDIYLASDREQELQREYGYKVDTIPYYKFADKQKNSKAGKIGGKIGGKIAGKITGKINGRKSVENGHIYEMQRKSVEVKRIQIVVNRKDTNEYVGTYSSQRECARQLHLDNSAIARCIRGNLKSTGGYTFKREAK